MALRTSTDASADKIVWSAEAEEHFLCLLHAHWEDEGDRIPHAVWKMWESQMQSFFPMKIDCSQLQSKRGRMLEMWKTWIALKNHTGLGWDPVKKTISGPRHVWKEFAKKHKAAAEIRDNGLPNEQWFMDLFAKSVATGETAYHPNSSGARISDQDSPMDDEPIIPEEETQNMGGDEPTTRQRGAGRSVNRKSRSIEKRGRRGKSVLSSDKTLDFLKQCFMDAKASGGPTVSVQKEDKTVECKRQLDRLGLSGDMYVNALQLLLEKKEYHDVFLDMDDATKKIWLPTALVRNGFKIDQINLNQPPGHGYGSSSAYGAPPPPYGHNTPPGHGVFAPTYGYSTPPGHGVSAPTYVYSTPSGQGVSTQFPGYRTPPPYYPQGPHQM